MGLFGEKCFRCGNNRTSKSFEGVPTCEQCELKIKAGREESRRCPVDSNIMKKVVVNNVIIDRCEKCGGIWIDKGELELIKDAIDSSQGDRLGDGLLLGMLLG